MTQAKITITRTRRGLGFPDTQRYVKRAAAAALKAASSAAWTARRTCCRFP